MTQATAEKKTSLKDDVLKMAELIESNQTIDDKTGIVTTKEDVYDQTLPLSNLTREQADAVHNHDGKFIAASAKATGNISLKAMAGNKELKTAETVIGMAGKNQVAINVDRTKTYPNPQDKENPIVKNGVVTVNYEVRGGHNSGQLKVARTEVSELADSLLA